MLVPLRLRTIAKYIAPGEKVADVGADHGLLELYLIARNTNNTIVAIENKKGPYEILREGLISLKDVRLSYSDGLEAVDRYVDTVVLAGMGGLNIVKILEKYPEKVRKLKKIIIDAHRDINVVREYLTKRQYKIVTEDIIFEKDNFYVITVFENVKKIVRYNKDQIDFGQRIYRHPLWGEYKNHLLSIAKRNLSKIKNKESEKAFELQNYIERLEKYGKN